MRWLEGVPESGVPLHGGQRLGFELGHVDGPGLQGGDRGRPRRHLDEIDLGGLVGRRVPVPGVLLEDDPAGVGRDQDVRPRPDRILAQVAGGGIGDHAVEVVERVQQVGGRRGVEVERQRERVVHRDALDHLQRSAEEALLVVQDGGLDRRRVHRAAVGEGHAGPEVERQAATAGCERPRLGQPGFELSGGAQFCERVVYEAFVDLVAGVLAGPGIERVRGELAGEVHSVPEETVGIGRTTRGQPAGRLHDARPDRTGRPTAARRRRNTDRRRQGENTQPAVVSQLSPRGPRCSRTRWQHSFVDDR